MIRSIPVKLSVTEDAQISIREEEANVQTFLASRETSLWLAMQVIMRRAVDGTLDKDQTIGDWLFGAGAIHVSESYSDRTVVAAMEDA